MAKSREQERICREWVEEHGYDVAVVFRASEGLGSKLPVLTETLRIMREGAEASRLGRVFGKARKFDALIAADAGSYSMESADLMELRDAASRADVAVLTTDGRKLTEGGAWSPGGRL
ncbi:hypothetical protein [Streptomyces sp. NPDC053048]|uniref:hypothetical protein n=1 Tax=Streptomyces sp. NPDC053048 TaxID=3365694 RepID=UPI0037D51CB3